MRLFIIKEIKSAIKYKEIIEEIVAQAQNYNINVDTNIFISINDAYKSNSSILFLEELKDIAIKNGGVCLSSVYVDSNYKKLNFFLQSSLSSHFQKFVHKVIGEMGKRGFQSKILLTIHDSVFVDIVVSEREEIFKIMREQNEYPPFMLNVKSLIKKVPDG